MAEDEVWVKLKRQLLRKKHFECKLSLSSRFKSVSETIRGCLNDAEMHNMVEGTQFGKLIQFASDYNLSSQIMWFLMVRQSYETSSDELWMVVNQRPLRFSKMEYALITGLDCSEDYPEIRETTEFRDRHFSGHEKVYIEEVAEKLKELRSTPEGAINLEKLKLACLYFCAAVICPVRRNSKPQVDNMLLNLVEDLDLFNKYPWGTMAFKVMLGSLKRDLIKTGNKIKERREETCEKKSKRKRNLCGNKRQGEETKCVESGTFSLNGFVHPLQILAYECIPGIAKEFAKPRDGYGMLLPRMCRWISNDWQLKSSPRYDEVVKASYQSKREVIGVLTPTEQELQAPYILNGQFNDSDPHLSHIVPLLSERKNVYCYPDSPTKGVHIEKMDTSVEQSPPLHERETHANQGTFVGEVPTVSNDFVQLRDYIDEKFTKLQAHIDGRMDERFTKIEDKLERIDEKFTKIEDKLGRIEERFTKIEEKLEDVTADVTRHGKTLVEKLEDVTADVTRHGKTLVKTPQRPTSILPEAKRQRMDDLKCVKEEVIPSEGSTSPQIGYSMIQPSNHILHTPQCVIMEEGAPNAHLVGDTDNDGGKKASSAILVRCVEGKRQIKKSSYLSSPFRQLSDTPRVLARHPVAPYNGTFQPLQIANSSKLNAHLKEQIRKMRGYRQCLMADYDRTWFNNLLLPRSWLGSSHINECMNGFLVLQKKYPHLVAQDIAIMGGYFSGLLDNVHSKEEKGASHCHRETLIKFAEGSYRKWKTIPWKDASSILVPYYVPKHWVAVQIDIKATSIIIYDCQIGLHKEINMDSYVRPLQVLIPRLLDIVGVETNGTWKITRPSLFPQNIAGGDCGAWVVKTIEVLLARLSPYEITDKIVDSYRAYLTACTWNGEWIL